MIRMVWQLWITRGLFAQEERSWWPNSTQILLEYTWWNIKRGEMRKSRNENQIIVDSRLHIPPSALSFTAMTSSSHHSLFFSYYCVWYPGFYRKIIAQSLDDIWWRIFNYVLHRHAIYASHKAELSHIWEKLHTMESIMNDFLLRRYCCHFNFSIDIMYITKKNFFLGTQKQNREK